MEKYILCSVAMFDIQQKIQIINEDCTAVNVSTVGVADLGEAIVDTCAQYGINKVRIVGQKNYVTNIKKEIVALGATKYNNNLIEVEIIS